MILTRNDLFSQDNAVFLIRVIKYGYTNKSFILTVTIYTNLVQIGVLGANYILYNILNIEFYKKDYSES